MDKETYNAVIRKQKRNKKSALCCTVCPEDDPCVVAPHHIEQHHIEGRGNSDIVIPLCLNCHAKVTTVQNKVPPKARSASATENQKAGYRLVTLGALLQLIGGRLIEFGHEMIAHG